MILTVTLNAALDRTVAVPNFHQGHRHRAVESRSAAGGKGVNVSRALSLLGRPVIATGLGGGPTGAQVLEQLAEESVLTDFTPIAAETRINLAVIDPTSGEQTEINERGPEVSAAEIGAFQERLSYLAGGARLCVLAGSLPPGARPDLYARLVKDLRARGVTVILDAEGEPMLAGLRAGPSVITPNEREAEELVGHEFEGAATSSRAWRSWSSSAPRRRSSPGPMAASRSSERDPSADSSRSRPRRSTLSRRSVPAMPSWPGTSPPASTAAPPPTASPTGSPAGPSRPSTSAPAPSTAIRSSGSFRGWRSSRSRCRRP